MDEKYCMNHKCTVKEVIARLEDVTVKAVVILNDDRKVIGIFSNGDMRRFFLKGGNLQTNIKEAMNQNPVVFFSEQELNEYRRGKHLVIYPIVNKDMFLKNIVSDNNTFKDFINEELSEVPLVIMAGGKGTRLYPYTKILPKALIPIGDKTISEHIIDVFQKFGCKEVCFILNHKASMIKAYFDDLEVPYKFTYVQEKEFLGTGGGLQLLKGIINRTFFLSNCDILINADLACAFKTHKMKKNIITFICALREVKIPYGIVETNEDGKIMKLSEKPEYSFLTNTGLYIVEPEVIDELKPGEFIHMPDIAQKYIDRGCNVGVFPVSEKAWLDMGQIKEMEDMMKAIRE